MDAEDRTGRAAPTETTATLRVLHVIPAVAERYGGPSAVIAPMCRALGERGVETLLLSTDADGRARLDAPIGTPTIWNGVPALFFRRDASEAFKYSRGLSRWVSRHVSGFDVVHIHFVLSHAPLAAAAACRHAGVPYVVRPLGTIATWSLQQKALRKRVLIALCAGRMLRHAAAIQYTTDEERVDAERAFHLSNGVVIPLGVDLAPVDAGAEAAREARPFVLFLSRLHPKKQLELLIDAFAAARTSIAQPWQLVVAGEGDEPYVRSLEERARTVAGDAIRFVGWVSGEAKRTLIGDASLLALPSRHENFGVSVLEAMAAGVPVLLSPDVQLAGAVSLAGAGWVADATLESMQQALIHAMASTDERRMRGAAARALATRYSWPHVADQLLALYRQVQNAPAAFEQRSSLQ